MAKKSLKKEIIACKILGIKELIVHLKQEKLNKKEEKMFKEIIDFAKKRNVEIIYESNNTFLVEGSDRTHFPYHFWTQECYDEATGEEIDCGSFKFSAVCISLFRSFFVNANFSVAVSSVRVLTFFIMFSSRTPLSKAILKTDLMLVIFLFIVPFFFPALSLALMKPSI